MSKFKSNDAKFFNPDKLKKINLKTNLSVNNDSDIGSDVKTVMPDKSVHRGIIPMKKIMKRKKLKKQQNIPKVFNYREEERYIKPESENQYGNRGADDNESILSEMDSVMQENIFENDPEKKYYNDIIFPTNETKIKYEYINMLTAFRNKGYDVQKVTEKDNIKKIMSVYEATLIEIKNKEKYELYNGCIYTIAWSLEWVMKYLQNGSEYEGWADHVWNHISEFKHHFDRMIVPTYEKDKITGQITRKENPSLINKYNPDPIFSVFLTLFRMFIVYTGLRKIANLTDYVPDRKSTKINNMSEEELSNIKIN